MEEEEDPPNIRWPQIHWWNWENEVDFVLSIGPKTRTDHQSSCREFMTFSALWLIWRLHDVPNVTRPPSSKDLGHGVVLVWSYDEGKPSDDTLFFFNFLGFFYLIQWAIARVIYSDRCCRKTLVIEFCIVRVWQRFSSKLPVNGRDARNPAKTSEHSSLRVYNRYCSSNALEYRVYQKGIVIVSTGLRSTE